jgi:hypothetical protein
MQDRELYRRILGIESPWYVERVQHFLPRSAKTSFSQMGTFYRPLLDFLDELSTEDNYPRNAVNFQVTDERRNEKLLADGPLWNRRRACFCCWDVRAS